MTPESTRVVTVFRSRLRPEAAAEYTAWSERMSALARTMPGYIGHKGFSAPDGERVTVVEFADEASHRAWAAHPEHREAQRLGRERFYAEFSVQVCRLVHSSSFPGGSRQ
ncbi:MAG: antibiotic biosynthesis monooxygenase family protein [Burkholderiales bacterium]